jgi:hypothetical protein
MLGLIGGILVTQLCQVTKCDIPLTYLLHVIAFSVWYLIYKLFQ